MNYKGKRIGDAEYFDDILSSGGVGGLGNAGILGGMGLDDYDSVRERVEAEGLFVQLNCRFCNRERAITVEWPELYQIGSNAPGLPVLMPQGWRFSPNNGTAFLAHGCPACGQPGLTLHMTPDEARRHVENAVQATLIPPQAIASWRQHIAALRSQFRG
jgi:hypothetical protein